MDPKETFYGSPIRKSLSTRYVLSSDFGLATIKERKSLYVGAQGWNIFLLFKF